MYQTYSLTRAFDADDMRAQTFTVSDDDAINCAHMLAAGFNTMSRNHMLSFVMAVVDTETGIVQYNGTTEQIQRPEPWSTSQTFTFNPTAGDADTILTLFGKGETPTFTAAGKFSFVEESKYAHVNRDVLESAYGELEDVKSVLFDAGVETIPAAAGVRDLVRLNEQLPAAAQDLAAANARIAELERRDEHERHARQSMEAQHARENESARAELIGHVKGAYGKWSRVDPGRTRSELKSHLRGMLEVLSKFLVAIGEADADERHAVALRVCEIPEGNYLYDES